ncbi:carbonic anhydrase [Robbsia sp. KACC 23696]|uniref:carbonic anhydrase n=1 Tax=Robbsia sp. KACC 23696 TaxID=3149231 RepID=UPI00325B9F06
MSPATEPTTGGAQGNAADTAAPHSTSGTCHCGSDHTIESLLDGVARFQNETFLTQREEFEALSEGQAPHTLFITCADSRVAPELITNARPGEIFVCRNIGNIVPAYGEMLGGVSAVIEYAVLALKVNHIIVCGHTNCGAMKALSAGPQLLAESMPTVRAWLRNAESARSVLMATRGEEAIHDHDALAFENVSTQLTHLRTHPSVAARLADGSLKIHGWVFNIGSPRIAVRDDAGLWYSDIRGTADAAAQTGGEAPS